MTLPRHDNAVCAVTLRSLCRTTLRTFGLSPSWLTPPMPHDSALATVTRRQLLLAGAAAMAASPGQASAGAAAGQAVPLALAGLGGADGSAPWRIAFGSCARQNKPQPIWAAIAALDPQLFIFLGDNFYADAKTPEELKARYAEFRQVEALQRFRQRFPHIAIWDDHDFGDDDVGGEYPHKQLSQQLFCDEWGEPADSQRRQREGIYQSWRIESGGRSVQIIALDLRYHRTALLADPAKRQGYTDMMARAAQGARDPIPGWYVPNADPAASLLDAAQWDWLDSQLTQPADLRILMSSVQFAAEGTGWEAWSNFPLERQRLLDLVRVHRAEGLVTISGDMHYGELSRLDSPGLYPIWDMTSSGLTEVWAVPTPNTRRASAGVVAEPNFGLLEIDWAAAALQMTVRGLDGGVRLAHRLPLSQLRMPAA